MYVLVRVSRVCQTLSDPLLRSGSPAREAAASILNEIEILSNVEMGRNVRQSRAKGAAWSNIRQDVRSVVQSSSQLEQRQY